jgi:hypothetical protein
MDSLLFCTLLKINLEWGSMWLALAFRFPGKRFRTDAPKYIQYCRHFVVFREDLVNNGSLS